jgi:hypothetical protein
MPKEVNPRIHVNEKDYPIQDHHCDDPVKKKMVMKLARMITDNIPRKLPGGMHENHMDFWILDRLLTKREIAFLLSFKKRRVGLTTAELAARNNISEKKAQKLCESCVHFFLLKNRFCFVGEGETTFVAPTIERSARGCPSKSCSGSLLPLEVSPNSCLSVSIFLALQA